MADITFANALHTLLCATFESMHTIFHIREEQMIAFIDDFVDKLPPYIANALSKMPVAV